MLLLVLIIIVGILTFCVMNFEEVKNARNAVTEDGNSQSITEKYYSQVKKRDGNNIDVRRLSARWRYLILFIASCVISTIAYWFVYKGVLNHIADSYTSAELDYYAYLYGNSFGNYIMGISDGTMESIYKVVMDVAMVVILVSGVFYKRTTNKKIDKRCCIFFFIAIGVMCGTFIFKYLLF